MGSHLFDGAVTSEERRSFRTARRRLNRKQHRINLLNELFAEEICKKDPRFFIRLKESGLNRDDTSSPEDKHIYFVGEDYSDKDYYKEYPTIHHLIHKLMTSSEPHDVRLVYIACAWLVGHRGHFLNEVEKENINAVLDFSRLYEELMSYFADNEIEGWNVTEVEKFSEILQQKMNVSSKEKALYSCFSEGKNPKNTKITSMVNLLCGGSKKLSVVFDNPGYADLDPASVSLGMKDEDFAAVLSEIGDDADLLRKLKAIYDWSLLKETLGDSKTISEAKIAVYEQHKKDLENLKYLIKKYKDKDCYKNVFKKADEKISNYAAYVYNVKPCNVADNTAIPDKFGCTKEAFCDYIGKILATITPDEKDALLLADIQLRVKDKSFMPKQSDVNNRVIPYQLYWYELNEIMKKASSYLPFLIEKDADGLSVSEKILSVFTFRVPYFVGPLRNGWAVRKEGRIYPWNFEKMVDLEASEDAFIKNLTNKCTYVPGEDVLPKNSLLYCKYNVLNEINNIKINGVEISPEVKQGIYNDVFCNKKNKKVTLKKITQYLERINVLKNGDTLSGLDETVKSTLKPLLEFDRLLSGGVLSSEQVEKIIEKATYTENSLRLKKWLSDKFSFLSDEDISYISRLKYNDFGRLSRYLLEEILVADKVSGEVNTVIGWMWETNNNFMQLMSHRFNLAEQLEKLNKEYYAAYPMNLSERLDKMYVSNSVKRPIIRTLDIVSDIEKAMGCAPAKVFVEMARGATEDQKNKRTKTRKSQLLELYSKIKDDDVKEMNRQLDELGEKADNLLQSDRVFLYFLQLGKCAYTGKPIENFNQLRDGTFNIEHIYPRAFIKDDSVLSNKVVVDSKVNGGKTDIYPVPSDIRAEMTPFWKKLHENKLMSDEKFRRLTRSTGFTDEERWGFINRQLVETRQSTKVIASLLQERFGEDTRIVYVKAGLVSELRHEVLKVEKTRTVNDLHHAKDAYLNIVAGNVYHTRFTENWFKGRRDDKYSIKAETVFGNPCKEANWLGGKSIDFVRKTVQKNAIHCTRYAYCKKGSLFDQLPVKAREGLVPRKEGLKTEKYGGYSGVKVSYFIFVSFHYGKKKDAFFVPVANMVSERVKSEAAFAEKYLKEYIEKMVKTNVYDVSFPLGLRPIKINTMISIDGLMFNIRSSKGIEKRLGVSLATSNYLPFNWEQYVKKLDSFSEKCKKNTEVRYDEKYDIISRQSNLELFDLLVNKLQSRPFENIPTNPINSIVKGRMIFTELDIDKQVYVLLQILSVLKTCRTMDCDLELIGGAKNSAAARKDLSYTSLKKKHKDVRIIDISASGLFRKESPNLLDLV